VRPRLVCAIWKERLRESPGKAIKRGRKLGEMLSKRYLSYPSAEASVTLPCEDAREESLNPGLFGLTGIIGWNKTFAKEELSQLC